MLPTGLGSQMSAFGNTQTFGAKPPMAGFWGKSGHRNSKGFSPFFILVGLKAAFSIRLPTIAFENGRKPV